MDERNLNGKKPEKVEGEVGAEAGEAKAEISFDDLKEKIGEEAAKLAVQVDGVSKRIAEIRKQLSQEDQKAISLGMTEQISADPELVAEFQRLDAEWNSLMDQVSQEVQKVDGLRKTENVAQAAEAGIDLKQKEQQLTDRVGKLEAKLKVDQDNWVTLRKKFEATSPVEHKAYRSAFEATEKLSSDIRLTSLAYLAAKSELAAIRGGEWSNKPPEDWLPSRNTELPRFGQEYSKGAPQVIHADSFEADRKQMRQNREYQMNPGNNIEDVVV